MGDRGITWDSGGVREKAHWELFIYRDYLSYGAVNTTPLVPSKIETFMCDTMTKTPRHFKYHMQTTKYLVDIIS